MPPLMPTAIAMAFELGAYGAFAGLLYTRFAQKPARVYLALIGAMLLGRVVWGLVSWGLYSLILAKPFTIALFLAGAFVNAWPGILVQLVLVPLVVVALEKAKLLPLGRAKTA